jgi:2,3-dihydroxybenzoate-AMP ligase
VTKRENAAATENDLAARIAHPHRLPGGTAAPAPGRPPEYAERYRAAGYWRGETFAALLRERAERHGDRIAVADPDHPAGPDGVRWSYAELERRADRLAAGFSARGIRPGDRVLVQLPNTAEFFEVVFGLFRIGALPVFALPAHRWNEIRHFCTASEAVGYVIPDEWAGFDHRTLGDRALDELPGVRQVFVAGDPGERHTALADVPRDPAAYPLPDRPEPQDLAFLQLSGGSTGVPKLIPRTHDEYLYTLRGSAELCGQDQGSVYLCALPAAHNFPLSSPGTLGTLYAGGTVVLARRPDPETAFRLIERERVTITGLVPPLALVWLEAAERQRREGGGWDLSSLRVLGVGGAKFGEEAARRVRPLLGCTVQQVLGMAEGLVNYTRLDDPYEIQVTTQGLPISPDDEIRVVDDEDRDVEEGAVGHLLTRGPYTIRGYWDVPEVNARSFTADGFYRTGDLVRRTPTGHLVVEGRGTDLINRGGEKVSAEEVENHLLAHPAVHDAALVGIADAYLGERSCVFLVPRQGVGAEVELKPPKVKRFLRERGLAEYKLPDRIELADSFPETGVGKVSRATLRAALAERLSAAP